MTLEIIQVKFYHKSDRHFSVTQFVFREGLEIRSVLVMKRDYYAEIMGILEENVFCSPNTDFY